MRETLAIVRSRSDTGPSGGSLTQRSTKPSVFCSMKTCARGLCATSRVDVMVASSAVVVWRRMSWAIAVMQLKPTPVLFALNSVEIILLSEGAIARRD